MLAKLDKVELSNDAFKDEFGVWVSDDFDFIAILIYSFYQARRPLNSLEIT